MNDEFTWPEETISSTEDFIQMFGKEPKLKSKKEKLYILSEEEKMCPQCGSIKMSAYNQENAVGHVERIVECLSCGNTWA